jgi:hypothetical protein
MIIRTPLPDEPLKAFVGRLKRNNICSSDAELFNRLISYRPVEVGDLAKINHVVFLAKVCGVDPLFFARQHTMLPFTKFVDWFDRENGGTADFTSDKYLGSVMRSQGNRAYLCPDCVKEDLEFRGITYWRRVHQLIGIDWCVKHGVALYQYEGRDAFELSPLAALGSCSKIDNEKVAVARDHPLVTRYARIAEGLLAEVAHPYHTTDVSTMIRDWAKQQDLRVALNGKRPLLSDRVAESFPNDWLALHFPTSQRKEASTFAPWVDGTWFSRKYPCGIPSYALAMTLMYESADDALNALANLSVTVVPRKSDIHRKQGTWATTEIVDVWMRHLGNCKAIAEDMDLSEKYVRDRLYEAGLPTLSANAGVAVKHAVQSYWRGHSLSTVTQSVGVEQSHVEDFLRVATERYLASLWPDTQKQSLTLTSAG